jgi:hypothetical protein
MAARRALAENPQTGLVLVRLCFGHQVAWRVAPTVGAPSASPPGWVPAVALQFAVLVRLAAGVCCEGGVGVCSALGVALTTGLGAGVAFWRGLGRLAPLTKVACNLFPFAST